MRVLLVCVALLLGKNQPETEEFLVYPNPARDFFTVNIPVDCEHCLVDVFDAKGKIVYSNPFIRKGETNIDCHNWIPGIYLVAIQADDIHKNYKLVKQ